MSSAPTETSGGTPLWSLRGRLIRLFAAGGAAAWLVAGVLILYIAEREDDGDWDTALERSGHLILKLASNEYEASGDLHELQGRLPLVSPGEMIQIRDARGQLLLTTAETPETPLVSADSGFHNVQLENGKWRVAVFRDEHSGLVAQVADSQTRRTGEFIEMGVALLVPLVIGLPVVMLGAWVLAAGVLLPLLRAARALSERSHSDLSPVGAGELPQEVQPLVAAFNHQLERLGEAREDERRFAASVAHELRTPLAGIRLNLQRLQPGLADPAARERVTLLIGAVDRATRAIEQLLSLARLERNPAREREIEILDPGRIIDETLSEFTGRAAERGIRFEVRVTAPAILAPSQAFYLVLRNFVENAVRHSPRDSPIRVGCACDALNWWLEVEDAGGGLKQTQQPGPSENLQLGLTLVRKIATLLDGRLEQGRSRALGGAWFRFSAPIDAPETDPAAAPRGRQPGARAAGSPAR